MKQIIIQGSRITDIASFYAEMNLVFMQGEDWQLGQTLDGFNDLLYGGFGLLKSIEPVELIWSDMELSRIALGYEATREYYQGKIAPDSPFNKQHFEQALKNLEDKKAPTYFDIILEIIAEHPNIQLVPR